MIGKILQNAIKKAGIPISDAASYMGISETNLYRLFKKDSFEVSYLRKAAELLSVPLSYFFEENPKSDISQIGDFNQAGHGNSQKIRVSKSPGPELAEQLAACRRELALSQALIVSQGETITLLKGSRSNPN